MSNIFKSLHKVLPHAYPFLLIDRVIDFDPGKKVVCVKNVTCSEEVLTGHNPHNYFPSVYIIEAMAQTSGLLMNSEKGGGGFLSMINDAKFYSKVSPGDQLIVTSALFHSFSPLFVFEVKVSVNNNLVAEAEITLTLNG